MLSRLAVIARAQHVDFCADLAPQLIFGGLSQLMFEFLPAPGLLALLVLFPQGRHGAIDTQGETDDQLRGDF
jgi:hypothetical protein